MEQSTVKCPGCGEEFGIQVDYTPDAPEVRARISPTATIHEYKLNTKQIVTYLQKKAQAYRPDANALVIPAFFKSKTNTYSYLHLLFNDMEKSGKADDFYTSFESIGSDVVNMSKDPLYKMIQKYMLKPDEWRSVLSSYKKSVVADRFGMSEDEIRSMLAFALPRRFKTKTETSNRIMVNIETIKVIKDMLEDPNSGKINGVVRIDSTTHLHGDDAEFVVRVYPENNEMIDDPLIRKMLGA
jgi:hypothetical protein|nr:MAG TPA: zinc-ribbon domain protein [Caudoviricetes sp.]